MVNEDPNLAERDGIPEQEFVLQADPSMSAHPSISVYPRSSTHPSTLAPLGDLASPSSSAHPSSSGHKDFTVIKVSKHRWAVVLLFSCHSMCNAFQWIQYGSISNIFMNFYKVSPFAIDWLSMCYMLTYIFLLLPVAWLLEKFGLHTIALAGSALNCLGAWVQLGSLQPHLFAVTYWARSSVVWPRSSSWACPPI